MQPPKAQAPTFFDKAVSFVSPEAGLKRLANKQRLTQFHYEAARPSANRKQASAAQHQNPNNYANNKDRQNLIWEARDAAENSPVVSGILDKLSLYTTEKMAYQSRTGDPAFDQSYESYFHAWCRTDADSTGRFTFRKLVELAFRSMLRDGDCGFVISDDSGVPKLSLVEADRIGNPNASLTPKNDHVSGVTIDDKGRPCYYDVYKRSLTNQYVKDATFDSDHFIHLFDPDRVDSYRGISFFHSVLSHIKDLKELLQFEKSAAKFASSYAGFISSANPYSNTGAGAFSTKATNTAPGQIEAISGKVVRLGEQESIDFAPGVNRPSGAFLNLVETLRGEIAAGLGLPIGFVTDFSRFGGVTARLESQLVMRAIQKWQSLLDDRLLTRVKNLVLSHGIAQGHLKAHKNWKQGVFQFGAHITADISHETRSDLSLLNAGIKTRRSIIEAHGGDFRETTQQLASEILQMRDISSESGVPIDLYVRDMVNATSMLAATQSEPSSPTMAESLGDKGVGNIIDLLENVGNGVIDAKSAIQTLVTLHNIPLATARKIVPQPSIDSE